MVTLALYFIFFPFSPYSKGRTYVLLFKSVKAEDAAEIKFTAEKASSVAKLKVKGWCFKVNIMSVEFLAALDTLKTFD